MNNRRDFLKKGILGITGAAVLPTIIKGDNKTPVERKKKIIYRTLGKTGVKLPIISMGVMNADNPNLVKSALDSGIIHLDTAHYYQRGKNEEMVGEVVKKYPKNSYFVATKVPGFHEDRKTGKIIENADPKQFLEKFELSLKRLQMKSVDLLYLHSVKSKAGATFKPLLKAMAELKKQGKIKYIGLSTHKNEPEVIRAAVDSKFYDVVLTAYNFKQPHVKDVKEAIAYAAKAGVGVVAMKTQAGVYWDKEKTQKINMKAALKWALQDENVHTAIPGFQTFDQLNLNMSIMEDLKLSSTEIIDLKFGDKTKMVGLYCQQCGSCLTQCDTKLNIPDLMRSYMYVYGYKNINAAKETIEGLDLSYLSCNDCSSCKVSCTMGFDLKERLTDIVRLKNVPGEFLV